MKATGIIPARYQSTRLPGKPLLKATGKYLIQHVWERASQAKSLSGLIIATDDDRIAAAAREFSANVCMTSPDHPTGTDRIAEVARTLDSDIIVNIQGDEPELDPAAIDAAVAALDADPDAVMSTLAEESSDSARAADPNLVKVVCDRRGRALYFSRSPIPCPRDPGSTARYLFHVGLYTYRKDFLLTYPRMPQTPLEQAEKLEQLRALENGFIITVALTPHRAAGIDTQADYDAFVTRCGRRCGCR